MWQLKMTKPDSTWIDIDSFETLAAAAKRIIEIEGYPVPGLFLELYVDIFDGSDTETFAFGHLEHTGRKAAYVVKRRVN